MKYLSLILILISAILNASSARVYGQWVATDGPSHPNVKGFARIDTAIFTIANGGIYRSVDNGEHWVYAFNGLGPNVYAIAALDSMLFVGRDNIGIYRSSDEGISWVEVNHNLSYKSIWRLVAVGKTLYALGQNHSINRSDDYGETWVRSDSNLPSAPIMTLGVIDSNLWAGFGFGMYVSTNAGYTWTESASFPNKTEIASFLVTKKFVMTATSDGIFISRDTGTTWVLVNKLKNVQTLFGSADTIYAGTKGDGVIRSIDEGSSWIEMNNGIYYLTVNSLMKNGNDLFAGTYYSGYYSSDNGEHWKEVNRGLPQARGALLVVKDTDVIAGAAGGVFRYDTDNTWKPLLQVEDYISSLAISGDTCLAGGGYWYSSSLNKQCMNLYLSIDGGKSWVITPFFHNGKTIAIIGNTFFIGTENESIFRSTDFVNWAWDSSHSTITSFAYIESNIFAGSDQGMIRSTDNGLSWTKVNSFGIAPVYSMLVKNSTLWVASKGVFFSEDLGENWVRLSGLTDTAVFALAINGKDIYAGIYGYGVLLYKNGKWQSITLDYRMSYVSSLAVNNTDLFCSTSTGIWHRSLLETNLVRRDEKNKFGDKLLLYPNPAQTTITFDTFEPITKIVIYNEAGNEIPIASSRINITPNGAMVDIVHLSAGQYFLVAHTLSGESRGKFVKE